jgi:broad specificity phosphatase PhoE
VRGHGDPDPHAEVVPGGHDPSLSPAGLDRAQELRHVLGDAGIGTVFASMLQRTQQTAAPIAADLGVVPIVLPDAAATVAAVRALAPSSVALVVGHTDTLPAIAAGLGGPALPAIAPTEFDRLFVMSRRRLTRLRYGA